MPETRSGHLEDKQVHNDWATDVNNRRELAHLSNKLCVDLTDADTFQDVFGVEKLVQFEGGLEDAVERLRGWATARERDLINRLESPEPEHQEAKTIAWTYMVAPDGTQVNVTAREGATPDMVAKTVLALTGGARLLAELGFVTQKSR